MSPPTVFAVLFCALACVPAERRPQREDASNGTKSPRRARTAFAPIQLDEVELATATSAPAAQPLALLETPFADEFERELLGDAYFATSDQYRLERGRLCVMGARNRPLWLRHRLPTNARIQVEAEAGSAEGDIKVEAWGNGRAAATQISYTDATGYLAIFGGWKNRYHVLARLDEHAKNRREIALEPGSDDPRQQPVVAGRRYRLKLERSDGHTLRFWVDDVEILSFTDPEPLLGPGHDHFAFNDWEARVCFDHLLIEPLPN